MSDRDNITLPREVVQEVLEALEHAGQNHGGIYTLQRTMLRTALAAEPTKQEEVDAIIDAGKKKHEEKTEPVGWQERHIYPNASGWSVWYPCRWRLAHEPREQLEQSGITYQWRPVYAIDAAMKENKR